MIHIKEILITFDWMEGYPEQPNAYTKDVDVYLDIGDKKKILGIFLFLFLLLFPRVIIVIKWVSLWKSWLRTGLGVDG
jgi:hypothetical protein